MRGLGKNTTIAARSVPEKAPKTYLFETKPNSPPAATHLIKLLTDKRDRPRVVAPNREKLVIELLLRV